MNSLDRQFIKAKYSNCFDKVRSMLNDHNVKYSMNVVVFLMDFINCVCNAVEMWLPLIRWFAKNALRLFKSSPRKYPVIPINILKWAIHMSAVLKILFDFSRGRGRVQRPLWLKRSAEVSWKIRYREGSNLNCSFSSVSRIFWQEMQKRRT